MGTKRRERLPEKQSIFASTFRPRNAKQAKLVQSIEDKEVTIAIGSSGTGKTYCALASALNLLGDKYKKIILVKSVTSIPGEEIGFIPGTFEEKMDPYIMSFTWNIDKIIGKDASKELMKKDLIEVLPLAYIRGLSIDNAIVIADEAQNFTSHTFKTIMTRIGSNSKYIFLGDIEQIDRKKKGESGLATMLDVFKDESFVGTVEFDDEDCVRNPIIPLMLEKLRERGI